ncbi:hypothetical protein M9Y10_015629 [Tritrichomonas musculus]|uniref:Uncharacterized protein n=2 Tax=Tritrichomonas musculus TaxID=1915356 RepID=A0ABR2GTJ2_9EUKA
MWSDKSVHFSKMMKTTTSFKKWLNDNEKVLFIQYAGENEYFGYRKEIVRKMVDIIPKNGLTTFEETLRKSDVDPNQTEIDLWSDLTKDYLTRQSEPKEIAWLTFSNVDDSQDMIIPSPSEREKEKEENTPIPPKKRSSSIYSEYYNKVPPAFRPRVMHADNEEL